ncbi:MAG: metallophosphoesterase family protein [Bacteroidales bacterium]
MWFFVSDLHGRVDRYRKLFDAAMRECPGAILLGGDLLPSGLLAAHDADNSAYADFVTGFLADGFRALRDHLGDRYPKVFLILGNDDPRVEESSIVEMAMTGLWHYLHDARSTCDGVPVYGYACVPPTPFMLKDWERYDVSRYVDPGCTSPEEGWRSVPVAANEVKYATMKDDLERLADHQPLEESVWLFHSPPHGTALDRAALDGVTVDYAPVDVHVGSIAIKRFIEARQPRATLHGHVHESARLTGRWSEPIGRTLAFSAAHDGPELALVRFDPRDPASATRELL